MMSKVECDDDLLLSGKAIKLLEKYIEKYRTEWFIQDYHIDCLIEDLENLRDNVQEEEK